MVGREQEIKRGSLLLLEEDTALLSLSGPGGTGKTRLEQRRNRNPKLAGDWVQLPKEGYQGPIPSVPGLRLNRDSQRWWRTIWRSPMASQWTEGDIPALKELAILRESLMDGKISVAAEVRLRSDLFGPTPAGRQSRRWMISDEDLKRAGISLGDEVTALREQPAKPIAPDG